jgi:hypothetical protein
VNKHELVDALQKLALDTKEIVVALHEHYPQSGKAEELRSAAETILDWADCIINEAGDI